jgi:hypothetical protein
MFRILLIALAMLAAAGAQAQTATPSPTDQPTTTKAASRLNDRNCIRSTGSLIPPKKGECLNVSGHSYSQDDLQRTGALTTGGALLKLDPSLSRGR